MLTPISIRTLLVANRGEIACRIMRTARELGIRTVAVYSDADASAMHVEMADMAVRIGPAAARDSYLRGEVILEAARASGADAVHPGYGFLSENAAFAEACEAAGIRFIGPSAEAIRIMGSKDEARRTMLAAGVPVVPGADVDAVLADPHAEAKRVGFPLLVKAVAGGGGKGMRVVRALDEVDEALAAVRREAQSAFGDDAVFFERWIEDARHVEVQVFGDSHGGTVHLLDRDCSTQRRHQKVMEEAPAADYGSEAMRDAAVAAARAVDYVGAGTVEFIATRTAGEFFFLEMNTRLQVEHPVTECVTGLDLVALQLGVAAGRSLDDLLTVEPSALEPDGHAIEFRLYAEDPRAGFLPATGTLEHLELPFDAPGVRVDTGVRQGDAVSPYYDPMIAKIIAHGASRAQALARMRTALAITRIHGVRTNLDLLRGLLTDELWCEVPVSTTWLEREVDRLLPPEAPGELEWIAAALALVLMRTGTATPFDTLPGFRLNAPASERVRLGHGETVSELLVERSAAGPRVKLDDRVREVRARLDERVLTAEIDGVRVDFTVIRDDGGPAASIALLGPAGSSTFQILDELDCALARDEQVPGSLLAPMPGQVIDVKVREGDRVEAGDALIIVEAMKMEHTIRAPHAGVVRHVPFAAGARVDEGAVLVEVEEG